MRKFNTIYAELKLYNNYKVAPSTMEEASNNMNIFFKELGEKEYKDMSVEKYNFLLMSYRHSAKQFILNFRTNRISFRKFMESCYNTLNTEI